jgi:purine nucleosidase/pyrimidine-specific ribonucleoside hydrolase
VLAIIDTDIGDDIDDALALAVALTTPSIDLVGITTAYGDVQTRARLARRLCDAAGRPNIPVMAGEPFPIGGQYHPDAAPVSLSQAAAADGLSDAEPTLFDTDASDFIVREVNARPGEIVIITIGAMTNLAVALQTDPSIAEKISRVVSLAGFSPPRIDVPEWNLRYDPAAARIVSKSGVEWLVVGADIARKITMKREQLDYLASQKTDLSDLLVELILLWARNKSGWDAPHIYDVPGAHTADVAAIIAAIDPDAVSPKRGIIEVKTPGALTFIEEEIGMHWLATAPVERDGREELRLLGF